MYAVFAVVEDNADPPPELYKAVPIVQFPIFPSVAVILPEISAPAHVSFPLLVTTLK